MYNYKVVNFPHGVFVPKTTTLRSASKSYYQPFSHNKKADTLYLCT